MNQPLIIGGLGGSGTRVICKIAQELGYFMGSDLNASEDNLTFTYLFKEITFKTATSKLKHQKLNILAKHLTAERVEWNENEIQILHECLSNRPLHPEKWAQKRLDKILCLNRSENHMEHWGWKEPNSHIYLREIIDVFPGCKYIHVTRNGLDMVYSSNQNQLQLWGELVLGREITNSPKDAFDYWHKVDKDIRQQSESHPERILMLNFDQICNAPDMIINELMAFLKKDTFDRDSIKQLIKKPSSIGRYKSYDNSFITTEQDNYLSENNFYVK
ncbi:sulfotransferase [Shewanella donghaensis]|uniref:sulfotransferase n=1 Tax=Shewanella donghaensis TaxID=238836 RepID=UPI001183A0C0|nr:sulfotransferase [Shewanella donghaensis]